MKKIGILHTAFLGDLILTTLLIQALHEQNFKITLFTKKKCENIFLNDPRIQNVVVVEKGKNFKRIQSWFQIAHQINSQNCDVLLVPHKSLTSTMAAFLSKVKIKIGFQNAVGAFLYPLKVPFLKTQHECVRYLEFLHPSYFNMKSKDKFVQMGRPVLISHQKNLNPQVTEKENIIDFKNMDFDNHQSKHGSYFIVSLGTQWETKKYPAQYYAEIVYEILSKNKNLSCELNVTQNENMDYELFMISIKKLEIKNSFPVQDRICNRLGKQTLSELSNCVSLAKFVLGNDSALIHFAAGHNIPCVAIFGPTHPRFGFGPTSEKSLVISYENEHVVPLKCRPCSIHGQKKCPLKHHDCMQKISPKYVFKAIEKHGFLELTR